MFHVKRPPECLKHLLSDRFSRRARRIEARSTVQIPRRMAPDEPKSAGFAPQHRREATTDPATEHHRGSGDHLVHYPGDTKTSAPSTTTTLPTRVHPQRNTSPQRPASASNPPHPQRPLVNPNTPNPAAAPNQPPDAPATTLSHPSHVSTPSRPHIPAPFLRISEGLRPVRLNSRDALVKEAEPPENGLPRNQTTAHHHPQTGATATHTWRVLTVESLLGRLHPNSPNSARTLPKSNQRRQRSHARNRTKALSVTHPRTRASPATSHNNPAHLPPIDPSQENPANPHELRTHPPEFRPSS
jgi:hypothetical protein